MKMFAWAFMVYIIEDEITDQIKKKNLMILMESLFKMIKAR